MASTVTRSNLKGYFNTGDKPTESNFTDLIDSTVNVTDDTVVTGAISLNTTARMAAGTGITGVAAAIVKHNVITMGNVIETTIMIDLTGLNSGDADGDIIGDEGATNCHYGQVTAAINGTILFGFMECFEAPLTGEPDIDLFSATVATGTEETLITALTETSLLTTNTDWTLGLKKPLTTMPVADGYLYLVASGGATNNTYTAGKFLIKLYGYAA